MLLADGDPLPYDDLVIATGAAPRPSPWRPGSGVYQLRTLADSLALKERFAAGGAVVMIGGGFIGAGSAAAARAAGCAVTIVDPVPVPMARATGPVVGELLAGLHGRHGVAARFGVGVEAVTGRAGDLTVTLSDGTALRAGTVVVGIGAVPNDAWLGGSGLVVADGVALRRVPRGGRRGARLRGRATSARWPHPELAAPVRSEHWTNAADQARCVAHNIAHPDAPEAYRPRTTSGRTSTTGRCRSPGSGPARPPSGSSATPRATGLRSWWCTPTPPAGCAPSSASTGRGRSCACRRLLDERAQRGPGQGPAGRAVTSGRPYPPVVQYRLPVGVEHRPAGHRLLEA